MSYIYKIKDKNNTSHPIAASLYGTCDTAAATATKTVICSDFDSSTIPTGIQVAVKFTYSNTAATPQLKLGSATAYNIYAYGTTKPGTATTTSWKAGEVVTFTFDGTAWLINNYSTDNVGTGNGNVTGLILTANTIILGNGGTAIKTSNKTIAASISASDGEVPTSNAVKTYVDNSINDLPSPMVFKGSLGTGGTITALPVDGTATVGDTYKVIVAGTYASQAAKVGDMFICDSKTSSANTWTYIPSADETDTNTIPSAYCDTAGSTNYKFAQCTDYTLLSNSYIQLILKNSNTSASELYLAIGHNGLQSYKPIYIDGSVSSSSNYTLPAGTYLVYYDGTNYYLRTDGKITSPGIVDINGNTTKFLRGDGTWQNTQDIYVDGASFTDNTSTDANNPVKLTLTREGTTTTVTGTIPKVSSSSAGVAPKGAAVSSQSQSTKFLREDGSWAAPSYTSNTDTNVTDTVGTANSFYPAGTTSTSTSTGTQVFDTAMKFTGTTGSITRVGTAKLTLGNSTASGTANNKQGSLEIYGSTAYAHTLSGAPTANRTLTLPNKTGTLAVTTDTMTPSSHTHGNIQNEGTLQTTDVTIASGDKLVVTDSSDSDKVARASISFDGSTTTKCLTQKGTWASFTNNSGTVTGSSLTADNIITGNGSTAIKSSGKTIATSITNVDTTVPTSKAVKTYADSINALTALCSTAAATDVKTITSVGPYTDFDSIPAGTTIHVMFENGNSASPIGLKIGSSSGKNIYPAYSFPEGTILSLTKTKSDSGSSTGTVWYVNDSTNYLTNRVNLQNYSNESGWYPVAITGSSTGSSLIGGNGKFSYQPSTGLLRVKGLEPEDTLTPMKISGGSNHTMSISGEKGITITGATSSQGSGIKISDASSGGITIKATSSSSSFKIGGAGGVMITDTISNGEPAGGVSVKTGTVSGITGAVPTISAPNLRLQGTSNLMLQGVYSTWPTGSGTATHINSNGYIVKYSSSRRYKDKIDYDLNLNDYHEQLMELKPCTFEYKTQPDETQLGLIAEDVYEVNPDLTVCDDGLVDSFKDRDILTMLVIEAQQKDQQIQSLQSEIELLKQRLDNLES